jgi:hypothetical protein
MRTSTGSRLFFGTSGSYATGLTTKMVLNEAGNLSIDGDLTVVGGQAAIGSTSYAGDAYLGVYSDDAHEALIQAYGNNQGTGRLFLGQGSTFGGGIIYNGDGTPAYAGSATDDSISFYRVDGGTPAWVFYYMYNNSNVHSLVP